MGQRPRCRPAAPLRRPFRQRQPLWRHRAPAGPGTGVLPRSGGHRPRQPRSPYTGRALCPHALERQRSHLYRGPYADHYISGPELRRTRRGLHRPGVSHGQCTPRLPCAAGRPYPHWPAPWRRYDLRQPLPSDPRGGYRGQRAGLSGVGSCSQLQRRSDRRGGPLCLLRLHRGPRFRRAGRTGISLRRGGGGHRRSAICPLCPAPLLHRPGGCHRWRCPHRPGAHPAP